MALAATKNLGVRHMTAKTEQPGRQGVLDAAAELFVAHGYAGTTLRQIADVAGIKAGSIYHHFASKQDLFAAVLEQGIVVMVEAFDEANSAAVTAPDRLFAHVRAHLGALFENGPFTTAHVTAFHNAPVEVRESAVDRRDAYENMWAGLLADLFPRINVKELALHRLILFGSLNSTIEWFDRSGNLSLDQLAQVVTDQFLHGVAS